MNIRLWGTRGSIPSPGPSTVRYGGNTSCVEVRLADGSLLILDAGTGIRPLGTTLDFCRATILLSHYHWDHIQGLPFFGPAYDP
jgi:phosphoribosyl 1,2-cyclic phosphodiesterase